MKLVPSLSHRAVRPAAVAAASFCLYLCLAGHALAQEGPPPPPPPCTTPSDSPRCDAANLAAANQVAGGLVATVQQQSFATINEILQGHRDQIQGTIGLFLPPTMTMGPTNMGPTNMGGRQGSNGPPTNTGQPVIPGPPGSGSPTGGFNGLPPLGETRFVPNQVLGEAPNTMTAAFVAQVVQQLGLTLISSQPLTASDATLYLFSFAPGRDMRPIIRALGRYGFLAEPNYVSTGAEDAVPKARLAQNTPGTAAPNAPLPAGDPAQYAIEKLHLEAVHRLALGRNVLVGVIDSEIDGRNPDLQGAIAETFDTTSTPSNPQLHGTGMAGAIAAHSHLLGVAPGANIVAIKAFVEGTAGNVTGTGERILRGLDHAIAMNVRVVNMSFAGPRDPLLERMIAAAYDKNITVIAAAGNAGPRSPPLFPGADPHAIAVTAVDAMDKPFAMANRGKHIALAAPGVDVLVPGLSETIQFTTGTSVAAANVSGVVALLLERFPKLTPAEIRSALTRTAKKILPNDKDFQTGAGLIDPAEAFAYLARTADLGEFEQALAYAPVRPNRNPLAGRYDKAAPYYGAAPVAPPTWSAWVEGLGDWERRGALSANDFPRNQSTYGTQGGFDRLWREVVAPGDSVVAGVFGSFMSSRARFTTLPFSLRLEGPGVGAYAMWVNGGLSTDVTARGDFFDLAEDFTGAAPNFSVRVAAPGVAENIQYKYWLGGPTFFEPTVGYMYTRALFDGSGAAFGLQDGTTLRVQAGARVGSVLNFDGVRVVPTLTALAYENAIQHGTAVSTSPTLPAGVVLPLIPTDRGLVRGEVIPQLNFYFSDGLRAFLQGGVRFGRDMVGGTAKAGLMRTW